jgi:hypothetical protein
MCGPSYAHMFLWRVMISIRILYVKFFISCGYLFVYSLCLCVVLLLVLRYVSRFWMFAELGWFFLHNVILSLSLVYFLYYLKYWVAGVSVCVIQLSSVFTHVYNISPMWSDAFLFSPFLRFSLCYTPVYVPSVQYIIVCFPHALTV